MKERLQFVLLYLSIIVISIIALNKNIILKNNAKTLKNMNESTQVANLQKSIETLNNSHTEYSNYVQECKMKISNAITNQGIETTQDETVEKIVENIEKIGENKYQEGYNKGHNDGYEEGYDEINIENLSWKYVEISAKPSANSASMSWNITSIPNYQKLEINKTLNPVMVSTFDMGNWSTSQSRPWKITWTYNASTGRLSVSTTGGPIVQYGTAVVSRKVGIYYLEF